MAIYIMIQIGRLIIYRIDNIYLFTFLQFKLFTLYDLSLVVNFIKLYISILDKTKNLWKKYITVFKNMKITFKYYSIIFFYICLRFENNINKEHQDYAKLINITLMVLYGNNKRVSKLYHNIDETNYQ